MSKLFQVMPVLHKQGLVQTKRMPQLHQFSRRGSFPEHLLGRVAGHDMNHQKNQSKNQPERRKRKQEALQEVSRH